MLEELIHELPKLVITTTVLLAILIAGLFVMPESCNSDLTIKLLSPSLNHPFGTDYLGRDMFAQTLSGISISLLTGIITTTISCLLAVVFALIASTRYSIVQNIVDTLTDLTIGIPHIVLLLLISFAFQKGALGLTIAIALTHWPSLSKILRNEIRSVRASDYYQISTHLPNSNIFISLREIVAAIMPQLITGASLCFPHAILHESTLTFLGFGFSPETPALGVILNSSLSYLTTGQWWLSIFPGISLVAVVLSINSCANFQNLNNSPTLAKTLDITRINVKDGEIVSLVGESGCGKTTSAKNYFFSQMSKNISFIPQSINSLDPTHIYRYEGKDYYPFELSGGMARKVLVDDSIKKDSELIIADEPFLGLDEKSSLEIVDRLQIYDRHQANTSLNGQNCGILLITHDLKLANRISDRLLVVKGSSIVEDENIIEKLLLDAPEFIDIYSNSNSACKEIKKIKVKDVSKSFDGSKILTGINFTFASNERVCIFGLSGCGKTTLSKLIAGYISPDSGNIDANFNVQYVSQNPYSAFNPCIKIKGKYPHQYSGGELQKLSIKRALKSMPDFIILDEATSMIDLKSQREIFEDLIGWCDTNNCGIIFVTHDTDLRDKVSSRIINL